MGGLDVLDILVIDDDDDMRQLLTTILHRTGHQVMAVASAEQGLELLPITTFQIAFLDQNLPGMEGLVLGEYLRKNNPHMKIALVTGSEDQRLERIGERQDITVIRKPFTVPQILDVVSAYQREAAERAEATIAEEAADHDLSLAAHFDALPEVFSIPNVPKRVEERITAAIRDALVELRAAGTFNERARVIAFAGIVTMQVLGMKIPKGSSGKPLHQEYDDLMREHRRRREFV
jgi:CheY-like chemotaxis protein